MVVIPREGGGSSTPWLLGSTIGVSGILGHPPSRVTTVEGGYSRLIAVTSLPAALIRAIASRVFSITVAM